MLIDSFEAWAQVEVGTAGVGKAARQQPLPPRAAGRDKEMETEGVPWASRREMFIVTYKDAGGVKSTRRCRNLLQLHVISATM